MDTFIRFVGITAASLLLSWFTFEPVGNFYLSIFETGGSWGISDDAAILLGLPTSFLFFSLLGTAFFFDKKDKYIYFIFGGFTLLIYGIMDVFHIYFPFIFGIFGFRLKIS